MDYQRKHFGSQESRPVAPGLRDDHVFQALEQDGTVNDDQRYQDKEVFMTESEQLREAMQHDHYKRRGEELQHS